MAWHKKRKRLHVDLDPTDLLKAVARLQATLMSTSDQLDRFSTELGANIESYKRRAELIAERVRESERDGRQRHD